MDSTGRMAAGVAVMAGCAVLGWILARGLGRRAEFLENTLRAVKALERAVCLRRTELAGALAETGFSPFVQASEAMWNDMLSPEDAWRKAREGGNGSEWEDAALDRLFAALGRGGMEDQKAALREAREALEEELARAKKQREETGKLYPALGALAGLAAAILLY